MLPLYQELVARYGLASRIAGWRVLESTAAYAARRASRARRAKSSRPRSDLVERDGAETDRAHRRGDGRRAARGCSRECRCRSSTASPRGVRQAELLVRLRAARSRAPAATPRRPAASWSTSTPPIARALRRPRGASDRVDTDHGSHAAHARPLRLLADHRPRARFAWPGGKRPRRLRRAQPRALRVRRGPDRGARAGHARSPTCSTTRGATTATASARGGCSSCSTSCACRLSLLVNSAALRPLPRARRRPSARAATRSPRTAAPIPSARRPRRGRRARADRRRHRDASRATRACRPAGWLGPVDRRDRRHARPAARGRLPLRARLVRRRPAGVAGDAQRAHPRGALPAGAERLERDHRRAASARPSSPT